MAAKIHLERMLARDTVVATGESVMNYLLVRLVPIDDSGAASGPEAMPLNVALVLDVSGSMYSEKRLENVKAAVTSALDLLKPSDMVSVVAFGNNAKTLLPASPAKNPQQIKKCIAEIDECGVDAGGTSMHLGIAEGVKQLRETFSPQRFNRVVVLTDGQTSGEDACRRIVREESAKGLSFSAVGVGTDWNENLLKGLTDDGKGNWHYIDSADKAREVFRDEFKQLAATAFANVRLSFRAMKDIQAKNARQVVPECKELSLAQAGERMWTIDLGAMQNDSPRAIVLDLLLPRRLDGQYVVGHLACTYDAPASGLTGQTTGDLDVRVTYSSDASQSYLNAQVARYIDELQFFEGAKKLQTALASGDREKATMLAGNLVNKATQLGGVGGKQTILVNKVLAELEKGGTLSRETQLALQDGARKTQLAE
jgi:Ca-activated chloride channel family protein